MTDFYRFEFKKGQQINESWAGAEEVCTHNIHNTYSKTSYLASEPLDSSW